MPRIVTPTAVVARQAARVNEPEGQARGAAIDLGIQLRVLAHVAADFIRVSDAALLVADPEDPRVAEARLDVLEDAAMRLVVQADRYRVARTVAHGFRDDA